MGVLVPTSTTTGRRSKLIRKERSNKMKLYSEKVKMVNESESRTRTTNHIIIKRNPRVDVDSKFTKSLFAAH